jgi:hypothetical protein
MIRPAPLLLATLALALVPLAARAQQGRRPSQDQQPTGFTTAEREAITAYFRSHEQSVRPLPPGIAKNLERGKPLPPGIAKQQIPATLQEALPAREGFEVTIFGDRIVLLEASGLVVDVLEGIFR